MFVYSNVESVHGAMTSYTAHYLRTSPSKKAEEANGRHLAPRSQSLIQIRTTLAHQISFSQTDFLNADFLINYDFRVKRVKSTQCESINRNIHNLINKLLSLRFIQIVSSVIKTIVFWKNMSFLE